mgnify:CR=1 FL=1
MSPPPRSSRLVARVGAALHALLIGVALRAMAPHAPWWVEVAVYAALAATGWWGVRVAERHPDEEPRQYVLRGARWIVAACLALAGTGFGAMLTSRTQSVSTLAFAFAAIAAVLALVAVGVVALGCAAGRAVTDAGDSPDALDQLAASGAPSLGFTGAAAWLLGVGPARYVALFAAAASLVAAIAVWRRDGARVAWIERVRAGTAPPWRWQTAEGDAPRRWSSADDGPLTEAIVREAPSQGAAFREAAAGPREVWGASSSLVARLVARRRRAALGALATVCALGVGATVYRTVDERSLPEGTTRPAWVGSLGSPVDRMSGSNGAVCAESGGLVWCWGANNDRFPGYRYARRTPREFPALLGLRGVSLSRRHACAVRVVSGDWRVVCWGYGGDGRLGGSDENAPAPRLVEGIDEVTQVVTGEDFSCALRRDGGVWCWGCSPLRARSGHGGCGVYRPEVVGGAPVFVEVAAGAAHVCGRTSDGAVWCWGDDHTLPRSRRISLGGPQPPHRIVLGTPARAIFAAPHAGFALDAREHVWRWGHASGLEEREGTGENGPITQFASDETMIAQGRDGGCAVMRYGAVACWGDNSRGQRGLGHTRPVAGVTRVPGLTGMRGVVVTGGGACAWGNAGVACWGAMGQAR